MPYEIFSIIFMLVFFLVIGMFIMTFVKGILQWNKNNKAPRLSVEVKVVSKRAHTSRHHHNHHAHTSTTYYVTFEVESGDRMELLVPATEYGILVEGDEGILRFQGTRYLGFERKSLDF